MEGIQSYLNRPESPASWHRPPKIFIRPVAREPSFKVFLSAADMMRTWRKRTYVQKPKPRKVAFFGVLILAARNQSATRDLDFKTDCSILFNFKHSTELVALLIDMRFI